VCAGGLAYAGPIGELEAFSGACSIESAPLTINGSTSSITLTSYCAGSGNSGYSGTITGQVDDFNPGPAALGANFDLDVPAYTHAPGSLTIEVTETGLTNSDSMFRLDPTFTGIFHSHLDTATYALYFDTTDAAFGTPASGLVFSTSETGKPPFPFTFAVGTNVFDTIPSPFSVTEVFTFTPPPSSGGTRLIPTVDGSVELHTAPEPLTLALFGAALAAAAAALRRRKKAA